VYNAVSHWRGVLREVAMTLFRLGELFYGPGGIGYATITVRIDDPRFRLVRVWASDDDADKGEM